MDPFARFPVEILWQILESCSDFTSLDGLQQISPRMEQAFSGSFKNITESVLRNCSHTSVGLHGYFTLLASIQSMPFTPETLLEELASLSDDYKRSISRPTIPLSTIHSLDAVRYTVGIAAKIHLTACASLQCFLNRLKSAKPRLPLDPNGHGLYDWMYSRYPPPQGGDFIKFDVDQPSWIESYRAHRGLWKLELIHQIHNTAMKRWLWSNNDMDHFIERWLEACARWKLEEIQTVSECVVDLCSSKPLILSHQASFLIAVPPPTTLTLQTYWPLPINEDTPVNSEWSRSFSGGLVSIGIVPYYNSFVRGSEKTRGISPFWKVDFKAFRRLGIPLWDNWRFYQMGLRHKPRSALSPNGKVVGGPSDLAERSLLVIAYIWFSLAEESDICEKPS